MRAYVIEKFEIIEGTIYSDVLGYRTSLPSAERLAEEEHGAPFKPNWSFHKGEVIWEFLEGNMPVGMYGASHHTGQYTYEIREINIED